MFAFRKVTKYSYPILIAIICLSQSLGDSVCKLLPP